MILVKENNGGGLSLECYDDNMNIVSVVTGLEFSQSGQGLEDIRTYGVEWDWNDVGGKITGYGESGNTDNSEYMAVNMIDNSEYTRVVAEWDGKNMIVHTDSSKGNAAKYFRF
jgi:hypothetical protein